MTTIVSQITSLTIIYSTIYSDANQRKHQSSASLAFVCGIHRDRWIPRTKGQLRGKCFHLMTSSWFPWRQWVNFHRFLQSKRSQVRIIHIHSQSILRWHVRTLNLLTPNAGVNGCQVNWVNLVLFSHLMLHKSALASDTIIVALVECHNYWVNAYWCKSLPTELGHMDPRRAYVKHRISG